MKTSPKTARKDEPIPKPTPPVESEYVGRVRPLDPPTCWFVDSDSNPGLSHKVDLEEFEGNGGCDCEHFMFRFHPLLVRGTNTAPLRCRHIKLAREFCVDLWLANKRRKERQS